jgi:hypothetical protein
MAIQAYPLLRDSADAGACFTSVRVDGASFVEPHQRRYFVSKRKGMILMPSSGHLSCWRSRLAATRGTLKEPREGVLSGPFVGSPAESTWLRAVPLWGGKRSSDFRLHARMHGAGLSGFKMTIGNRWGLQDECRGDVRLASR